MLAAIVLAMMAWDSVIPSTAPEFNVPIYVSILEDGKFSYGTLLIKSQITPDLTYRLVLVGDKTKVIYEHGSVAKLVDALDSKSSVLRRVGSSPSGSIIVAVLIRSATCMGTKTDHMAPKLIRYSTRLLTGLLRVRVPPGPLV